MAYCEGTPVYSLHKISKEKRRDRELKPARSRGLGHASCATILVCSQGALVFATEPVASCSGENYGGKFQDIFEYPTRGDALENREHYSPQVP